MTQRTWWLWYWLAWILWALAAIAVLASEARAEECYTPLTCLYGNNLGRSMEYDRLYNEQQRQRWEIEQQREEIDNLRQQQDGDAMRERDRYRRYLDAPPRP